MRSQDAYNNLVTLLDKEFNGNITPARYVTLVNIAQLAYMDFLIGSLRDYRPGQQLSRASSEASGRAMDAIMPFWKPRFAVPVSNGIAQIGLVDADGGTDYAGLPQLFLPGWQNPACGEAAISRYEIPLERIPAEEWPERTHPQRYNTPTIQHPAFQMIQGYKAMVLPLAINSLWATYIRKPVPITLAVIPGTSDPDPLAVNSNFEWNDLDVTVINDGVVGLSGLREQVPSWLQYAERKGVA